MCCCDMLTVMLPRQVTPEPMHLILPLPGLALQCTPHTNLADAHLPAPQSGHGFTYKDSRGIEHPTSFMWYIVFVCGTLPLAIGSCYKQKCLKGVDLDVMWSGMWTGIWQMVRT
jgi:hypothetical protein